MGNDNDSTPPQKSSGLRFRIAHLLYVTAVISSALSTFGSGGFWPAVVVIGAWGWVFLSKSRPETFWKVLAIVLVGNCVCGLFLPAISPAREAARRMVCSNNLKQIALALHNYHDVYKSFPPAYIADSDGRPLHSWRVLILPFLEQQPLYDTYRFDEPWDGPNNRTLLGKMPDVYRCPSRSEHGSKDHSHTSYVAIVGEDTVWPGQEARAIREILDGSANTLLVCELSDRDIAWTEPTDVSYSSAIDLLTARDPDLYSGHVYQNFFYESSYGRQIAIADGSVHFLGNGIGPEDASRLLTINDGEPFDFDEIHGAGLETRRLRIDNCVRLAVFVLLALWPLPWVWINPTGTRVVPRRAEELSEGEPR